MASNLPSFAKTVVCWQRILLQQVLNLANFKDVDLIHAKNMDKTTKKQSFAAF
jgi:hypothetical protein